MPSPNTNKYDFMAAFKNHSNHRRPAMVVSSSKLTQTPAFETFKGARTVAESADEGSLVVTSERKPEASIVKDPGAKTSIVQSPQKDNTKNDKTNGASLPTKPAKRPVQGRTVNYGKQKAAVDSQASTSRKRPLPDDEDDDEIISPQRRKRFKEDVNRPTRHVHAMYYSVQARKTFDPEEAKARSRALAEKTLRARQQERRDAIERNEWKEARDLEVAEFRRRMRIRAMGLEWSPKRMQRITPEPQAAQEHSSARVLQKKLEPKRAPEPNFMGILASIEASQLKEEPSLKRKFVSPCQTSA